MLLQWISHVSFSVIYGVSHVQLWGIKLDRWVRSSFVPFVRPWVSWVCPLLRPFSSFFPFLNPFLNSFSFFPFLGPAYVDYVHYVWSEPGQPKVIRMPPPIPEEIRQFDGRWFDGTLCVCVIQPPGTSCKPHKIILSSGGPPIHTFTASYELSSVKFLWCEVRFNDESFPIPLQTSDYTYYVVGNTITLAFLQYYLFQTQSKRLDLCHPALVTLFLLDQHANPVQFTFAEQTGIRILETDYVLI